MPKNKIHKVGMKRKRERKTNYRSRIALLLSEKPRIVIRKSLSNITVQAVEYSPKGDKVIASAKSRELAAMGYTMNRGNIPSAYLTGLLLGKRAMEKGVKEAVADIGLNTHMKGSRVYAALKGAVDAGLKVPCSEEIFPPEERITGKHISDYAQKLKSESNEKYEKAFSRCLKHAAPEDIPKQFEAVKSKIMKVK